MSNASAPQKTTDVSRFSLADDGAARASAFLVRIVAGLLFLENLSWKVPPHFGADDGSGLYYFTGLGIEYPVLSPYASFLESVVLPNFAVFGWGVFLVEIGLAVFLLLGLATRLWALIGVGQAVAIFLSVGSAPNEWRWSYFLMVATLIAVFGFASGRVLGLDAVLRPRVSRERLPGRLYRLAS